MNGTVLQEFTLLFIDLAMGVGIGFLFDCYRILRRVLRPGWLVTQVADFFFWICCAILAFRVFFVVTGGEVNFYNLLIIPAGAVIYLKFASIALQWPLLVLFLQLCRLLAWIMSIFRHAVWLLWQIVVLPFRALWWLVRTCLQLAVLLLRILWLPENMLLRWLWRLLREVWRHFGWWLHGLLRRLLHRT